MHTLFFMTKPRLSQAEALLLPKDFVSLSISKVIWQRYFRSYNPNQIVLFPQRIDENIPSDDPVRILNAMVDSFDLSSFHKLYKESGRSAYHP